MTIPQTQPGKNPEGKTQRTPGPCNSEVGEVVREIPAGMREVSKVEFYQSVGRDQRDVMPSPVDPHFSEWKTRDGLLVGRTSPGWKHPREESRYFLTSNARRVA